jgi:glycosyltransferase involved in cell wall biosynthesis
MLGHSSQAALRRNVVTRLRALAKTDDWSPAGLSVTAILCTYNRFEVLLTTLERLAASQLPSSVAWEVLVVDNNSTDQTREVVEGFCRRYPGIFRYVFEPTSGKSHALNTGVMRARGKVLAFVDDDVAMEPPWLHHLTASLHDGKWAGSGGRILPAQAFAAPAWFSLEGQGALLFGLFDSGDQPCEIHHAPHGGNMAFRKEMFEKYGLFRTDIGPGTANPEIPRHNEDTEFGRRLIAAGERLRYEPQAIVYHPVILERINQTFFLEWWFDFGRATARELTNRPDVWGIRREYLKILKALILLPIQSARWIFSFNPQKRFRRKSGVWETAGRMIETYRLLATASKKELLARQETEPSSASEVTNRRW